MINQMQIQREITAAAKEADCHELDIISAMQTECAKRGEEDMLKVLCDIKWDFIF